MAKLFFTSITRISDLEARGFNFRPLPRETWATGDYVVCEVVGTPNSIYRVELPSGRRTPVLPGQLVVGAFGRRAATLECVGDWQAIGDDMRLNLLTGAGLLGKATSVSSWTARPMDLVYRGHAMRESKINMRDFVELAGIERFDIPIVLVAGTSMSAGKTLASRCIVAAAKGLGLSVAAAKIAGAAGYKDALTYGDAGADVVFDHVDAGLGSTVCAPEQYVAGLKHILARVAETEPDVFIAEIGASPLEPYNGKTAMALLEGHVRMFALAASDPYAAFGFCQAVAMRPDFITGAAANTEAAVKLVEALTDLPVIDISAPDATEAVADLLRRKLPVEDAVSETREPAA